MKTLNARKIEKVGERPGEKSNRAFQRAFNKAMLPIRIAAAMVIIGTSIVILSSCSGGGTTDLVDKKALKTVALDEAKNIYGDGRVVAFTKRVGDSTSTTRDQFVILMDGSSAADLKDYSVLITSDSGSNPITMTMDSAYAVMPGASVVVPTNVNAIIPDGNTGFIGKLKNNLVKGDKRQVCEMMGRYPEIMVEVKHEGERYYMAGFGDEGRIGILRSIEAARGKGSEVSFRKLGPKEAEAVLSDPGSKVAFIG